MRTFDILIDDGGGQRG